jgi:cobalamin biosynthesis protein CbiD
MALTIRATALRVAVSGATIGTALLLAGCAATPDLDQSIVVTYRDAGEPVEVTVPIPQLECTDLAGTSMFTADEDGDRTNGRTLLASVRNVDERYVTAIDVGEGIQFFTPAAFGTDDGTFTLDNVTGTVGAVTYSSDGASTFGADIDAAATANANLKCTSTN